jgi:hypothetical protein
MIIRMDAHMPDYIQIYQEDLQDCTWTASEQSI